MQLTQECCEIIILGGLQGSARLSHCSSVGQRPILAKRLETSKGPLLPSFLFLDQHSHTFF